MASYDFCYGCPKCQEENRQEGISSKIDKIQTTIKLLEQFVGTSRSGCIDLTIALLLREIDALHATRCPSPGVPMQSPQHRPPVKIKKLAPDVVLPEYANEFASGADAFARETKMLVPGERHLFKFGFAVQLPPGWEMQCRAKSGRALKEGLALVNGIGTIDTDYRGEMGAIVINFSDRAVVVEKGTKLAQLVIVPVIQAKFEVVEELDATERGEGGFGSTGLEQFVFVTQTVELPILPGFVPVSFEVVKEPAGG